MTEAIEQAMYIQHLESELANTGAGLKAVFDQLAEARTENAELRKERDAAYRLLESLTPGGSEFYESPKNCAEFAKRQMSSWVPVARERNELRAKWSAVPWVALNAVIEVEDDISDWNQAREWVDANRPQQAVTA
jgi:hypothetical protein